MPITPWAQPKDYFDRMTYYAPDGVEYMLSSPVYVLQEDGFGMPPMDYVTERGPFQHGETVKDVFLRPRVIQMIVRRNGCSRAEYWNIRNNLLSILRPNRGVIQAPPLPGILRRYLANNTVREWFVYPSEGPSFASRPDQWDQWSINDTIRFTAYDPVARDPRLKTASFASSGTTLTFPVTFPIQFGAFGGSGSTVTYNGTWIAYPTIVMTGPLTGPIISNLTTGQKIEYDGTIGVGHTVTIDLTFGIKTVKLDDGTNMIGNISTDSNIADFHLQPGVNSLKVSASGSTGASSVVLQWYERFIGI